MDRFSDHIAIGKIGLVWDIVHKIVDVHFEELSPESVSLLIDKVFIRVKKEVKLLQEREKEDTIDLVNCLRIFMSILRTLQKRVKGSSAVSQLKHLIIQRILPVL